MADRLPAGISPAPLPMLKMLDSMVAMRVAPAALDVYADFFRSTLARATGVSEAVVPPDRPSPERGRAVFQANCAACHGARGAGDGVDAARLGVKPANFTDLAFIRDETPWDFFNVVSVGRKKGGMPAWGQALSSQQIWDAVSYIWSLGRTPEVVASGQRIYGTRCAGCHGATGDPGEATAAPLDRSLNSLSSVLDGAPDASSSSTTRATS